MINPNGMAPWHMFLNRKGIISYCEFVSIRLNTEDYAVTEMARAL
jgi:hypothetical protein